MYGSLVTQTIKTSQHITQANQRLQKIGYKIGLKMVDQFMRQNITIQPCQKYSQIADKFCTIGIKKFINPIQSKCQDYQRTQTGFSFKLRIVNNPILRNVEVPSTLKNSNLQYQSIFKGMIKGSFEVLKLKTQITILFQEIKRDKNQTVFYIQASKDQQSH